MLFPTK